ncbi:MAG: hypothetical protein FD180_3280 [Planctomycetota bacterium]|nr:MAG: hypothetical protein FD180_3280 [Planctomycetota bacterium]
MPSQSGSFPDVELALISRISSGRSIGTNPDVSVPPLGWEVQGEAPGSIAHAHLARTSISSLLRRFGIIRDLDDGGAGFMFDLTAAGAAIYEKNIQVFQQAWTPIAAAIQQIRAPWGMLNLWNAVLGRVAGWLEHESDLMFGKVDSSTSAAKKDLIEKLKEIVARVLELDENVVDSVGAAVRGAQGAFQKFLDTMESDLGKPGGGASAGVRDVWNPRDPRPDADEFEALFPKLPKSKTPKSSIPIGDFKKPDCAMMRQLAMILQYKKEELGNIDLAPLIDALGPAISAAHDELSTPPLSDETVPEDLAKKQRLLKGLAQALGDARFKLVLAARHLKNDVAVIADVSSELGGLIASNC